MLELLRDGLVAARLYLPPPVTYNIVENPEDDQQRICDEASGDAELEDLSDAVPPGPKRAVAAIPDRPVVGASSDEHDEEEMPGARRVSLATSSRVDEDEEHDEPPPAASSYATPTKSAAGRRNEHASPASVGPKAPGSASKVAGDTANTQLRCRTKLTGSALKDTIQKLKSKKG